jgi:hypothetical protein
MNDGVARFEGRWKREKEKAAEVLIEGKFEFRGARAKAKYSRPPSFKDFERSLL